MNTKHLNRRVDSEPMLSEDVWLESQSIHLMMEDSRYREFLVIVAAITIAVTLYPISNIKYLLLWVMFLISILLLSTYLNRLYFNRRFEPTKEWLNFFYYRIRPLKFLVSFAFGCSALFIFTDIPIKNLYICLLINMGFGLFTTHTLSPHRFTAITFINIFATTFLFFYILHLMQILNYSNLIYHLSLLVLILIFWYLLYTIAIRLSKTHLNSLKKDYDNQRLIQELKSESDLLLKEKVIALDAIAVKRRFISSAAHDIRQPVMAMSLYADWLTKEPDLVAKVAPKILEASKSINVLFDSLFDLDNIEAGQIHPELSSFDAASILREIANQYTPLAAEKGLELRSHISSANIYSDEILFRRIVGNLLGNAIKYSVTGGVLLGIRKFKTGYNIEVWDTGLGIAPEHKDKVFKEFFKVKSGNGSADGFGLGLPIVKRLTKLLPDAELEMYSVPNRGSVFKFFCPKAV